MNLKRYNEFLVAAIGTALLFGVPVRILWTVVFRPSIQPSPGIELGKRAVRHSGQVLESCAPVVLPGGDYQYFPVAALLTDKSESNVSISTQSYARLADRSAYQNNVIGTCDREYPSRHTLFNVVIRNVRTNEQTLLLKAAGVVKSLVLPDAKCASGEGALPCGTLVWGIQDRDTNHDGVVNELDAEALYVSDPSAKTLTRISPEDSAVLSWQGDPRTGEILLQVRRDGNKDGQFTEADGVETLSTHLPSASPAVPVIQPDMLQRLQKAVQ